MVSAFDFVDGEQFLVTNVQCDQEMVAFDTLMPSTGRAGRVVLKAMKQDGRAV